MIDIDELGRAPQDCLFCLIFFSSPKTKKKRTNKANSHPRPKKNECETVAPQFPEEEEEEEEEDDDDEEEEEDGEAKTTHHTNNQYSFL